MSWHETPMQRFVRCPVHGQLAVMVWGRRGWRWLWACQACLAEADPAVGNAVEAGGNEPRPPLDERGPERIVSGP